MEQVRYIKLNINSFNARFYCWFYLKEKKELPTDLLKYLGLSILAWIFLIPYIIVCAPSIMLEPLGKKVYNWYEKIDLSRSLLSTLFNLVLILLTFLICAIFNISLENHTMLKNDVIIWVSRIKILIIIWFSLLAIKSVLILIALIFYNKKNILNNNKITWEDNE